MGKKRGRRNAGRVCKRRSVNDVQRRYRKRGFGARQVQDAWDYDRTVRQNFARIGLVGPGLNDLRYAAERTGGAQAGALAGLVASQQELRARDKAARDAKPVEFVDAKAIPSLREQLDARHGVSARGANHMTELERAYLRPLIAKYGLQYRQMERDLKLNYNQLTRVRLERRCKRFVLLQKQEEAARAVEDNEYERLMAEEEEDEEDDEGGLEGGSSSAHSSSSASSAGNSSDDDDDDDDDDDEVN